MTAESHEATDFLNGLPGAGASGRRGDPALAPPGRLNPPAVLGKKRGEVPGGIHLVALPITAPVRGGPAQQQHITQADTDQDPDHFRTSTPPGSRTSFYFPRSARMQLLYHQQTKNILVSYSPKKLGFF
ncbi:hypothetical protein [Streptomyces sp. NPDC040750]|uniref:hypothetical protein n=1 Tax=Streptomyces sp. NPDC040750 TaxID=3154491 RepID=UPI003402864A